MQFGAGSDLAAQCQPVPTPNGWRPWAIDSDGPVPDALALRAQSVAADTSVPLGTTESYPLAGVTALIRIQPNLWSRDAQGGLTQGCFRVGGIFLPDGTPAIVTPPTSSPSDGLTKTIGYLTVASLVVGTVATAVTLRSR